MRRTKIVCTVGPVSSDVPILRELIMAGMDVARLNFSHGTHETHAATIVAVRQAARENGGNIALLLDTKGPEIRIGLFREGQITLHEENLFSLTTDLIEGDEQRVSVNYPGIIGDVTPGMRVLLDDGLVVLEIVEITDTDVKCRVLTGGTLSNHKGVNIPDAKLQLPAVSPQDREDIIFAIKHDMDFIAASFTRKVDDVLAIRAILEEFRSDIQIIA
ncbi:MAG: pyruvate kinase, partial [Firmicutes bacterium]|nr:pyruvate kinase [Bacillota bacterium]